MMAIGHESEGVQARLPKDEVFRTTINDEEPEVLDDGSLVSRRSECDRDLDSGLNHDWVIDVDGPAGYWLDVLNVLDTVARALVFRKGLEVGLIDGTARRARIPDGVRLRRTNPDLAPAIVTRKTIESVQRRRVDLTLEPSHGLVKETVARRIELGTSVPLALRYRDPSGQGR